MWIDLSDDETTALLRELDRIVESDRYPFSPRIRTLPAIRAKLSPEPAREPATPAQARRAATLQQPPVAVKSANKGGKGLVPADR